jgi:uncharacterized protein
VPVSPFRVNVTGLRRTPGARRREYRAAPIEGLEVTSSRVPAGTDDVVDVVLEASDGGIVVTGTVSARWIGECRRCLREVGGELVIDVRELYEDRPAAGHHPTGRAEPAPETYPVTDEAVDLLPLARDAILLNLPQAPLCRPDCAGLCVTCGADLNDGPCSCLPPAADARWAPLDALRGTETP